MLLVKRGALPPAPPPVPPLQQQGDAATHTVPWPKPGLPKVDTSAKRNKPLLWTTGSALLLDGVDCTRAPAWIGWRRRSRRQAACRRRATMRAQPFGACHAASCSRWQRRSTYTHGTSSGHGSIQGFRTHALGAAGGATSGARVWQRGLAGSAPGAVARCESRRRPRRAA